MTRRISAFGLSVAMVGTTLVVSSVEVAAIDAPVISFPADGETVDQGQLTVRGTISQDTSNAASVMFLVDVSGSTGASGFDCDGDGFINSADDSNGNGIRGEILDCEISGVVALNTQLAAIPGSDERINVGLVPFGTSAAVADVGDVDGVQQFVSPVFDGGERDRAADIIQAASSMTTGSIELFTRYSVGGGTRFTPALEAALDALDAVEGPKFIFMMSDGFGSLSSSTLDRIGASDVEVRTFAIGTGSDRCASTSNLVRIAEAGGSSCSYAPNPGNLTTVINTAPPGLDRVEVVVDGGDPILATVDALGNFAATTFVRSGDHTVTVTAFGTDGTSSSTTHQFTAGTGIRYVALGDSYSAGEGITPFADVPGPGQGCHQSTRGYATLIGTSGYEIPGINPDVNLDYVACSGAVLRDILSVRQDARGERHIVQLDRVDSSADLITMTIGGNDMGFSNIAEHCATQFDCFEDGFTSLNSGRSLNPVEFIDVRLALLVPQLQSTYQTIRSRSDDKATVLILDYPELFDDGIAVRLGCKEAALFERSERVWLNDVARTLSLRISRAAGQAGVWFTSVIDEFKGHRVCDGGVNTQSEWLVGHETAANKNLTGDASFHPDDTGAEAYARIIATFLNDTVDAGAALNPSGLPLNPGASPAPAGLRSFASATAATSTAALPVADVSVPGFTEAEIAEIAAMTFGSIDIAGLSALRGDATCANLAAPGEQLVMHSYGFAPDSPITASIRSATDTATRDLSSGLVADAAGAVHSSFIVPTDFVAFESEDFTTAFTIELDGTNSDGGAHHTSELIYVDTDGGDCTTYIASAGDIAIDGIAPSASTTPGVPAGPALTAESLAEAYGCVTGDAQPSTGKRLGGTPGDDVIVGDDTGQVIQGGEGDDIIIGGAGDDTIIGGQGDDIICGGGGNDVIVGTDGDDIIIGGSGDDQIQANQGDDIVFGGPGDDSVSAGAGNDYCAQASHAVSCELPDTDE